MEGQNGRLMRSKRATYLPPVRVPPNVLSFGVGSSADLARPGTPHLGFRNFSICQIRLEISRNFTEISGQLNRKS